MSTFAKGDRYNIDKEFELDLIVKERYKTCIR